MLLGYTHSGIELYLDRHGKIRPVTGWRRIADRARGFLHGLRQFRIDQLTDHSVLAYIDCIFEACLVEESAHKKHAGPTHH
jgi:hypothetical protein